MQHILSGVALHLPYKRVSTNYEVATTVANNPKDYLHYRRPSSAVITL